MFDVWKRWGHKNLFVTDRLEELCEETVSDADFHTKWVLCKKRNPHSGPHRTEPPQPRTRKLFCRSAVVLGPRRTEPPGLNILPRNRYQSGVQWLRCSFLYRSKAISLLRRRDLWFSPSEAERKCFCSTGAAEDGRAPTEEGACREFRNFCSTKGRAPTKSLFLCGLAGSVRWDLTTHSRVKGGA